MQYWVSWLFEFNQVQGGFDLIRIRVFVSKFHSSEQDRSTNRLPVTVIPLLQGTLGTKRTWRGIVVAKQRNIFTGKPLFYDIINVFTMIKIPVSRWEESLKKINLLNFLRLDGGVKFMTLWWIWYQKWQKSLMRHWVPFLCVGTDRRLGIISAGYMWHEKKGISAWKMDVGTYRKIPLIPSIHQRSGGRSSNPSSPSLRHNKSFQMTLFSHNLKKFYLLWASDSVSHWR